MGLRRSQGGFWLNSSRKFGAFWCWGRERRPLAACWPPRDTKPGGSRFWGHLLESSISITCSASTTAIGRLESSSAIVSHCCLSDALERDQGLPLPPGKSPAVCWELEWVLSDITNSANKDLQRAGHQRHPAHAASIPALRSTSTNLYCIHNNFIQ